MTESLLLTFLENVYIKNVNYCVVCLRTSEERKLAKPYYVKDFAMSINQPFMLTGPNHMACYICERQAAAALRYRKASSLATFAINVMATIKKNHKKCEMIRNFNADEKNQAWLSSVLQCESEIVQQRARSQLLLTEVLVVSSPTAQPTKSGNLVLLSEDTPMVSIMGQTHITNLGESRDLYVVPDDAPRERVSEPWELTQKPTEEMSSIIIYDEEDDPININPEIQPTNDPALTNDPIAQQKDPLSVNTTADATNKLVPIHKLLQNPRVGQISRLDSNTIIQSAPTEFILHPIIFNSGMMTVPSLSANIVNGKLITNNTNSSNLLGTPQLALQVGGNLDFISDPNQVTNVLRVLSHQDVGKVHVFTGAIPNTSLGSSMNFFQNPPQNSLKVNNDGVNSVPSLNYKGTPIEVGNTYDPLIHLNPAPNKKSSPLNKIPTVIKYSSTSKNPSGNENPSVRQQGGLALLRADRIDWEDKIPMDVISFVDKNDTITKRPRYSNNTLGISDVVSLNNEEVIIDLC